MSRKTEPVLTAHDVAVWHTVHINDLIDAGRFADVTPVTTPFVPDLGAHEKVVAQGPFVVSTFRAEGDGSYLHQSGWFYAPGYYGAALGAVAAVGLALGNSSRRAQAQAAATPRWRPDFDGLVSVTDWGFYLHTRSGVFRWDWAGVQSLTLLAPRRLGMEGRSTAGPVTWIVDSDWSELIFTLWARARHPRHTQLASGAWVPPGWRQRVEDSGTRPPVGVSGRWRPFVLLAGVDAGV